MTENSKTYRCIVADPPWKERGGGKIKRGADRHYPLLTTPAIIEAMLTCPLWQPDDNCHLWMWTTKNHRGEASIVMAALGFREVSSAVWVKGDIAGEVDGKAMWRLQRPGLGQYLRGVHEHLILGVRGKLAAQTRDQLDVIVAPRGKHSEKPEAAYRMIEQISPGPRLEMFARKPQAGWDSWGQDIAVTVEDQVRAMSAEAALDEQD